MLGADPFLNMILAKEALRWKKTIHPHKVNKKVINTCKVFCFVLFPFYKERKWEKILNPFPYFDSTPKGDEANSRPRQIIQTWNLLSGLCVILHTNQPINKWISNNIMIFMDKELWYWHQCQYRQIWLELIKKSRFVKW